MAAMALNLGVALRKPGVYVLNPHGKPVTAAHTVLAIRFASKALLALVFCAQAAMIFVAFWSERTIP
jgi:adenosylcobinamide-phosphate synthase